MAFDLRGAEQLCAVFGGGGPVPKPDAVRRLAVPVPRDRGDRWRDSRDPEGTQAAAAKIRRLKQRGLVAEGCSTPDSKWLSLTAAGEALRTEYRKRRCAMEQHPGHVPLAAAQDLCQFLLAASKACGVLAVDGDRPEWDSLSVRLDGADLVFAGADGSELRLRTHSLGDVPGEARRALADAVLCGTDYTTRRV